MLVVLYAEGVRLAVCALTVQAILSILLVGQTCPRCKGLRVHDNVIVNCEQERLVQTILIRLLEKSIGSMDVTLACDIQCMPLSTIHTTYLLFAYVTMPAFAVCIHILTQTFTKT